MFRLTGNLFVLEGVYRILEFLTESGLFLTYLSGECGPFWMSRRNRVSRFVDTGSLRFVPI